MTKDSHDWVDAVVTFSHAAHKGQKRRGLNGTKIDYMAHIHDVVRRTTEYYESRKIDDSVERNSAIAMAWLHDVMPCERPANPITEQEMLDAGIPARVVDGVKQLSHEATEQYTVYIGKISDPAAIVVKIADELSNLADLPTRQQIKKYAIALQQLVSKLEYRDMPWTGDCGSKPK